MDSERFAGRFAGRPESTHQGTGPALPLGPRPLAPDPEGSVSLTDFPRAPSGAEGFVACHVGADKKGEGQNRFLL